MLLRFAYKLPRDGFRRQHIRDESSAQYALQRLDARVRRADADDAAAPLQHV